MLESATQKQRPICKRETEGTADSDQGEVKQRTHRLERAGVVDNVRRQKPHLGSSPELSRSPGQSLLVRGVQKCLPAAQLVLEEKVYHYSILGVGAQ